MKKDKQKKRSFKENASMILRGYKMLFTFSRKAMVWRTVNAIYQQLPSYFILYMSARILNELIAGSDYERLLTLAIITVVGQFLLSMLSNFINRKAEKTDQVMWNIQDLFYMKKQNRMEYRYLDDSDITIMRLKIVNAANFGGYGFMQLYWCWWQIIRAVVDIIMSVTLAASLFLALSSEPQTGVFAFINSLWSSLVLAVMIALNIIISTILSNRRAAYNISRGNEMSKMYMSSNAYWNISWGMDSRIFRFGRIAIPHIIKANAPEFREETRRVAFRYGASNTILMAILNIAMYLFVGAKAFMGVIGIGNIMLYYGTIRRFINAFTLLSGNSTQVIRNNDYMQDIFDFFDLPEENLKGDTRFDKSDLTIEFRNVTFKYPKTEVYALKNVSCRFEPGSRIAMVGRNGSGKTTFIKLLCRLYEPDEGEILVGGVPINEYKYDEYIAALSVVFQDFYTFQFSIAENVATSDQFDRARVEDCLRKVGLGERIDGLNKGIDTLIGRRYNENGIELSGGETQKLAIARALYKDSPIVILDEPTASLDPIAESEIYEHFNQLVGAKSAIYISHRLSSCRFCDKIAVFEKGELVQFGSHDDLLSDQSGKYAELWNAQAQYYI